MKLREELETKIADLQFEMFPDEYEYCFFEFLADRIAESKDLSAVSNQDYLMALVLLERHESFEKVSDMFEDINGCLDKIEQDDEDIVYLLTTIYGLKAVNLLDKVLELDHEPSAKELDEIIKKYDPKLDGVINGKKSPKLEVVACVVGYRTIGLDVFDNFEQLQTFTRHISKCEDIDKKFTKFINYKNDYEDYKFLKKNYSKLTQIEVVIDGEETKRIDNILETMDISDVLKQISNRQYELSKERKQFIKNTNKQTVFYNHILEIINSLEENEIASVKDDILSKLDDSEISCEFIKELLEHNRKVYSKLELENIKKDKYNQIEKLFGENDIYLNVLSEETRNLLLKNGNIATLKEIISFLKESNFSWLHINHPNYVQIVLNTNAIILQTITNLIQNGIINKEFVRDHIGILIDKIQIKVNENDVEPCYDLFRKNISLLLQNTDNLQQKLTKNESIVFLDTECLLKSLELIKKYGLNLSSENAKLYGLNIISDNENFDDLDQFIELGYKDYIQNNPQLLREDSKEILIRLSIITNVGLDPMNKENRLKGSITSGKNFYVANDQLNEYRIMPINEYTKNENFEILNQNERMTISESTEELDIIRYLDTLFKVSDLEYQINETTISRNKVLRNMECLLQHKSEYEESEIALSAIIYHSVIDNNTIEFIKEKLNEYKKEEAKKKTYNI